MVIVFLFTKCLPFYAVWNLHELSQNSNLRRRVLLSFPFPS